jgi:hypothetical protein
MLVSFLHETKDGAMMFYEEYQSKIIPIAPEKYFTGGG